MMKYFLDIAGLEELNDLFLQANSMERWGSIKVNKSFNQLTKQSLNGICTFFMGKELEENGKKIDWTLLPGIMLFSTCRNCYASADVPQSVIKRTLTVAGLKEDAMEDYTLELVKEKYSQAFSDWMCKGRGSFEEKLYCCASKIATLIELSEITDYDKKLKSRKRNSINSELDEFKDIIPCLDFFRTEEFLEPIRFIAKLRAQNRWAVYPKQVNCSVLGHLFDTGVYSYVLAKDHGMNNKNATTAFFMGLFHDLAEVVTKDMPSTTKDGIPGYRKASEIVEDLLMEEELYPLLAPARAEELRKMNFEKPSNATFRAIVKGGDYLSAVSEIDRQVKGGTRYAGYLKALIGHERKFADGTALLSKNTRRFYKRTCRFAFHKIFFSVQKDKMQVIQNYISIMLH